MQRLYVFRHLSLGSDEEQRLINFLCCNLRELSTQMARSMNESKEASLSQQAISVSTSVSRPLQNATLFHPNSVVSMHNSQLEPCLIVKILAPIFCPTGAWWITLQNLVTKHSKEEMASPSLSHGS